MNRSLALTLTALVTIVTLAQPATLMMHDFVYDQAPFPSCHASTLAQLSNGDILAAWFGGSYEGSPDVCVYTARLTPGATRWTAPTLAADGIFTDERQAAIADLDSADHGRKACYNPVLFQVPDGPLLLFFKIGRNVQDWTGWYTQSCDNGHTWCERRPLPPGCLGPIKDKPVLVGDRLLCPSSTERGGWQLHFETYALDAQRSLALSPVVRVTPDCEPGLACIQPTILQLHDGTLQLLARTQNGCLATSRSHDGGTTWSTVTPSALPNNNSGVDAVTLRDGRHLLVYNPVAGTGPQSSGPRTPLTVALSDDGTTWHDIATLEDDNLGEYSYPAVIQAADGTVHITYTWRRQRIRHAQLSLAVSRKQ